MDHIFSPLTDLSSRINNISLIKGSDVKKNNALLKAAYPNHTEYIDTILDKKNPIELIKCSDRITLLGSKGKEIYFWSHSNSGWIPTLRILHKYPSMLPKVQIDCGATKFILRSANVMAPGVTSVPGNLKKGDWVAVYGGADTPCAMAIGHLVQSPEDIMKEGRKDVAVEISHVLMDALWSSKAYKN